MAITACIASFYCLYEWLVTHSRRYWALYTLSSVAILYLHYLFAFVFIVQILYIIARRARGNAINWKLLLLSGVILALSALPLRSSILLLLNAAHTLPFAGHPSPDQLITALLPLTTVFAAVLAWLAIQLTSGSTPVNEAYRNRAGLLLIALWWLAGPLFFYSVSSLSTMSIFVDRYIAFSTPAVCLLLAWVSSTIFGLSHRRRWLFITMALIALNPAMLKRFLRAGSEEYGPAIRIVNALSDKGRVPVFVRSPLIESNYMNWKASAVPDSYLFAPIAAYPLFSHMIPLPNKLDDDAKKFITSKMTTTLGGETRLLALAHWDDAFLTWLRDYFKSRGYQARTWQPNSISVLEFRKE